MALPTPTPYGPVALTNPGFEDGTTTGWSLGPNTALATDDKFAGTYSIKFTSSPGATTTLQTAKYPTYPGHRITASVMYQQGAASAGQNPGTVIIQYYDENGAPLSIAAGTTVNSGSGGAWNPSTITNAASPAGARSLSIGIRVNRTRNDATWADNFSWNYDFRYKAELIPVAGTISENDQILARISITPDGTDPVVEVRYFYMTHDGSDYENATLLGTATADPWAVNGAPLPEGNYALYAEVELASGIVLTTESSTFSVGAVTPPDTREFQASNAYTFLVGENFSGLASAMPSTALVTGAEVVLTYSMDILGRTRDVGIDDPEQSTSSVVFSVVQSGTVEAVLLNDNGSSYSVSGTSMTGSVPINEADFSVVETGVSEEKLWTVYELDSPATVTVGGNTSLFGQANMSAPDFLTKVVGIRFYPVTGSVPSYAAAGDACYRFKIGNFKLRVYFDAGSTEYYFSNEARDQVIKADLVAGYVENGSLVNGDASGVMQIANPVNVDGSQTNIEEGWTIHSGYPVTDINQIGTVSGGMEYNGLPTYEEVEANRSRYQFITANFYGDPDWESIYGVNGVGRAFSYNGEYFYKIVANPVAEDDRPRHIANHLSHLALGYGEGRVDLSVVGQPYNFSGVDGASSWAFGDNITGLLELSGTMLGVFCRKSIWGLAGSTVDNFSPQVISPKMGAIEYTVADMAFPVYANVYGIYTLSQTQEYGDYKGTPLSQDISPWLRKRLKRDATASAEVVTAWPVRAKNQYKLAFSDGYVLTMTMNFGSQQAPTFSKQKYFYTHPDFEPVEVDLYAQPSIVPAAISSELDHTGEERIHVAPKITEQTIS